MRLLHEIENCQRFRVLECLDVILDKLLNVSEECHSIIIYTYNTQSHENNVHNFRINEHFRLMSHFT